MTMISRTALILVATGLAGCSDGTFQNPFKPAPAAPEVAAPAPVVVADTQVTEIGAGGVSPDRLDTTSDAELAEASSVAGGNRLGETVASLGDPTQTGLWLRTPLVSSETPGRIEAASGQSLAVTLLPLDGPASGGSQISLSAMRGLELGLTDLPTLTVFRVSAAG